MLRSVMLALGAALLVTLPARAADDPDTARARQYVADAQLAYKLGEFEKSVVAWKDAYRLKPVPAILFNLAQALRMAGDYPQSRFQYENYLRDMPNAPNRLEVERQIEQLQRLIAEQATAEQELEVDEEEQQSRQDAEDKTDDGTDTALAARATADADPLLQQFPDPEPGVAFDPGLWRWVAAGTAAALAVGGVVTYGLARSDWSAATAQERSRAEVDALLDAGDTKRGVALGLGGAAAVAGAGAGVLFVF